MSLYLLNKQSEGATMKRKICIVGGVAGGATIAAKLRRLNEVDEIILFEKDEYISFANCGLPYYVGKVIKEREKLIVETKEDMSQRFNLDIRNFNEVTHIDRERKVIKVVDHQTQNEYEESYDILVLSPGASPIVPPFEGLKEADNVFILRNIPHVDAIVAYLEAHDPKHVTVIGGGFIGVEMAENLKERGLEVSLVDMAPQCLAPLDFEMAQVIHQKLSMQGIELILNDGVKAFLDQGRIVETASGRQIKTDMIILAIGVNPEIKLAQGADLAIGDLKAIKTNQYMQTSDPSIYALGDAIEVLSRINKLPTKIPLAAPANRQAVVAANHINGVEDHYEGALGTAVVKVFDLVAASTGFNERMCKHYGLNYEVAHIERHHHVGYYPDALPILMKIIFSKDDGQIYGAQAVGYKGVEKRIDVIATAIAGQLTVKDLPSLELAYAPPFGAAKDPVNILGYVASHIYDQSIQTKQWYEVDDFIQAGGLLVDVRTDVEYSVGHTEGGINLELDNLRQLLDKLPVDKSTPIMTTCHSGHRGYLGARVLINHGYTNVYNLSGGYYVYKLGKSDFTGKLELPKPSARELTLEPIKDTASLFVDAKGLQCPGPLLETYKAMESIEAGEMIEVEASDIGFYNDVISWAEKTGNTIQDIKVEGHLIKATILKGAPKVHESIAQAKENATIVLFSGEFDKAMAAFIIANGAAAMGKKVSIFFTFWGLNALRKNQDVKLEKSTIEALFGKMMPKGAEKLPLSNMNMGGMGKMMINKVMKDKNVLPLSELMKQALEMKVEFIACTMSMDIMGIKREELIDEIALAGVGTYLAQSDDAGLTLFI